MRSDRRTNISRAAIRGAASATVVATVLVVLARAAARAQDADTVGPNAYRCTLRNEHLRVCEVSLDPGESVGMHEHPEHVAYMITAGRLLITTPDGASHEWESRPGHTALAPAERHALRNVGDTEVRGVIVEFLTPFAGAAAGEGRR